MGPSKGACYSLLLFLMVGLLPQPTYGSNLRYKLFLRQNWDEPKSKLNGKYCDNLMSCRGLTRPSCKEVNTFIHGSKRQIRAVCNEGGLPYGHLRRSLQKFRVTECKLKGASYLPPCKYRENSFHRHIVIGCEDGWPVHYDEH